MKIESLWVGQFKTGSKGFVVYDPALHPERTPFVVLFLLDDLSRQEFAAADVRQNLSTVTGPDRQSAVEAYIRWLDAPKQSPFRNPKNDERPPDRDGWRGMPWLDDWGA